MIGPEIKRLRLAAGFSTRQLAEIVYKSPGFITQLEIGFRIPTPETVLTLAIALKADPELLVAAAKTTICDRYDSVLAAWKADPASHFLVASPTEAAAAVRA
jgi:transcriptional regulator with XRE-family HTH domain